MKKSQELPKMLKMLISYAPEDRPHADELAKHLKPLEQRLSIRVWHEGNLTPGQDSASKTAQEFSQANILLLMISPDYLASEVCMKMAQDAMAQHISRQAAVIPINLRPTSNEGAWFASLVSLPRSASPITKWENQDQAWVEVVEGIRQVISNIRQPSESPTKQEVVKNVSELTSGSRPKEMFTINFGSGGIYRSGPLVVKYLEPDAVLRVANGPPWEAEEDAPTIIRLKGNSFRGEFFVDHGWSISGESKSCVCSGLYPFDGLPLENRAYDLSDGAKLFHQYGKSSYVAVPIDGPNLEARKAKAIEESQVLWGVPLECEEWSAQAWSKYNPPLTAAWVSPRY